MKIKDQSKKLTIIILSYNRQNEILKKINFWSKYNFKILIMDGSKKKLKFAYTFKNIKYFHIHEFDYYKRLFFISKKIKTKYIKLESDDDYFSPSALIDGVNFLHSNRNFSAVAGQCGIYSSYKDKVYINSIFNNKNSLVSNSAILRVKKFFKNYNPSIFYSITTKEILLNNIKAIKQSKKFYGPEYEKFSEIHFPLTILVSGKVKFLKKIFWIRKDDDITNRYSFKTMAKKEIESGFYPELFIDLYSKTKSGYLKKFLTNIIKINTKGKFSLMYLNNLENILINFYSKIYFRILVRIKNNKFIRVKKFFLFLIPRFIKKKIRFFFRINGPNMDEILSEKIKLSYKFKKNEFLYLNNFLKF